MLRTNALGGKEDDTVRGNGKAATNSEVSRDNRNTRPLVGGKGVLVISKAVTLNRIANEYNITNILIENIKFYNIASVRTLLGRTVYNALQKPHVYTYKFGLKKKVENEIEGSSN
ncbi:UNVERIFIED_CONTAM: hypothetical protein NCL1_32912 [Trichonephila clavipes]